MKNKNNQPAAKIRVMLVDDHAVMREALRAMINSEPDLMVVAAAPNGQSALELLGRTNPDVILMDASMPEMSGIEATRQLKQLQPAVRIIGLTLYEGSAYVEEMIAAGVSGYMLKTNAPTNLANGIRTIVAGGTYFDSDLPHRSPAAKRDEPAIDELSTDELAVVKRLADGWTNTEIAGDLELTIPVVRWHKSAAMKKLNVRSRAELARVAAILIG